MIERKMLTSLGVRAYEGIYEIYRSLLLQPIPSISVMWLPVRRIHVLHLSK